MKKFGINGQMRNKLFLIIIYRFSLVKAAMMSRAFVNCAMVLTKCLKFLFFQMRNKDHSALVNCGELEFLKLR
jgi:hypothetical protein